MKILIVPTIREIYKNQIEYCVDRKLIDFFKSIFKNSHIELYNNTFQKDYDLIVLGGGNNSIKKMKVDKLRDKINKLVYKIALKKNIKILGICHGAHFLAKKNGFNLKKSNKHVGFHDVFFRVNNSKFKKYMNSFHTEIICNKKLKDVNIFGFCDDKTVEAFHIKNKKILAIMWHPERYKKSRLFDKRLVKQFYATNSIVCR